MIRRRRSATKLQSNFAPRARCEGGLRHDGALSTAIAGGASAAAVAWLQEHGEAFAVEAADPDPAYAVGTDRAGLWPRDGARERPRSHASRQGRAARRTHHRARPCAR